MLTAEEARALLDAIDTSSVVGLRDRALIGMMVFTFARVGAVQDGRSDRLREAGRRHNARDQETGTLSGVIGV